jgi:hypothetical protein
MRPAVIIDPQAPTSTVLRELLLHAPEDRITLGWLMGSLGDRSFGIVLLLLGLLACLPAASAIVGIIIALLACQMILLDAGPCSPGSSQVGRSRSSAWLQC